MSAGPPKPPPIALALEWVSRIIAIALVMVLPGMGGAWLDKRLGTAWLAPLGFVFGMMLGIWYLLVATGAISAKRPRNKDNPRD